MPGKELKNCYFYGDTSSIVIRPNSLEHGYLLLLQDDILNAKRIFDSIDSPRGVWASILVSMLQAKTDKLPTYFQIRNFMEIDLDFLIKNEKLDFVQTFLNMLGIFVNINNETYKYAARVMIANNLMSAAFEYMELSKRIFYNDPELHFMLAKFYMEKNSYKRAKFYINECLTFLPNYYPAILLKEKIEENIF